MTNDNIQGLRDKVEDTREIHARIRYIDFKTMEGCQFEIIEELHTKFESSHLCTIQKMDIRDDNMQRLRDTHEVHVHSLKIMGICQFDIILVKER